MVIQAAKAGLEEGKNASGDGIMYITPFHSLENKISNDIKFKLERLKQDDLKARLWYVKNISGI
jgi:basic membrane protein A and related proteins